MTEVDDWIKPVIDIDADTIEYLDGNLPNEQSIRNARAILQMLHHLDKKPSAVRCSGVGGVGICYIETVGAAIHYAHLECFNDGEVAFHSKTHFKSHG